MNLTKRKDGRFCASIQTDHKRAFFYSSEPTKEKAEKDIKRQILNYKQKEENGKTVAEVVSEWEEHHFPRLAYQTLKRYRSLANRVVEYLGDEYIRRVEIQDVNALLLDLQRLRFSTKSIKDHLSILKLVFKFAMAKRYVDTDPTAYVSALKGTEKSRREFLTDEEIETVKANVGLDFGLLALFYLFTGLRKGEALALTGADIDVKNKTVTVNKSIEFRGNTPNVKPPKTEAGERVAVLPEIVAEKLPKLKPNEILFNQRGEYMTASYFRKHWAKYCRRTGLQIHPQQLRHTYVTMLYELGIPDKDAQHVIGHADITTTRRIYTHIRERHFSETVGKISDALRSI